MTIETQKYDYVGYIAAVFLCGILIPQLFRIYKLKKVDQISWYFVVLSTLTSILFLTYGVLISAIPMIVANIIVCLQNLSLMYFKYTYS